MAQFTAQAYRNPGQLEEGGVLDQRIEDTDDPVRASRVPSPQLVGTPERAPLDLNTLALGSDVRTIVWATGFRPDYSWLDVPVLDRRGHLKQEGGVVDAPGLYVLGLPYLRRRKSSFIHGAEDDVRELSAHLAGYLDRTARPKVAGMAG